MPPSEPAQNRHHAAFLPPAPLRTRRLSTPLRAHHRETRARGIAVVPVASLKPTNPATQYVPLHVHSDFSLLDGASQLPSLVKRAEELAVPALALTDHGVLYGAIQLVRNCRETSVKPIIGNEMYVVNDHLPLDPELTGPAPKRYHLIVLAKDTTGYRNLVKLTTMAHLSGKVGKGIFARPCINKAQLYEHREGLIVSSACLGGEIPQAILNDDMDAARSVASWFRDVFGDDFYLEIQDHGSKEDKKVNPAMIQLSQQLNISVIATNDSHFTSCLDAEAHDAMICIQTGKLLTDDNRLHYAGNEYFKSVEEMRKCFVDHLPIEAVDEALFNTINVASKVQPYDLFGATRIPDFPVPRQFTASHDDYLRQVSKEGLVHRLETRCRSGLITGDVTAAYTLRLEEELDMICHMGFSSYFLVVWDYIKHARELDIPVGPGRGSAAGSLVAFALRITDVDPIAFNLLFERFLNPERKSMPDIDTDFSVEGRERIINYVSERYGRDRVAQIITFNRLTSKAVLKDVARVHNVPYAEADRLAKLIPVFRGKPATLTKLMSDQSPNKDFKRMIEKNPSYQTWLDKAQRIEGANKTFGIHAAGVVISASPLNDIVPLSKAKHGETITQYAMEDVEALGLLKMDFLGLKNLTIIETALRFINEGRKCAGIVGDLDFSVDALPLDDAKTYKLLAEGELDGIFQLDASGGMRSIVRELRPSSLEDISSILALYRPGPLDAGLIPKFIRRKHGIDPIQYDHPLLEPILQETYGIMVYQEQIMRIARDLAGYSLGQADILRRAMGKKKSEDMKREKPKFVEGAKNNGVSEQIANTLFDQMLKFAEYCFNKSHSTAYAYLTYQTAFLKANYPVEYCAAVLRSNMNQSDKLVRYLADANTLGVRVLPPSVNRSELGFTVDRSENEKAVVLFGLEAVKTVGESVSKALIEERSANGPFLNIIDLIERVDLRVLNKRAMGSLIQAGAFDELHPNRKVLLENLDGLLVLRRKLRDKRKRREAKGMSDEEREALEEQEEISWEGAKMQLAAESRENPDFDLLERLAGEKATMGFYASGNPLYDLRNVNRMLGCTSVSQIVGEQNDNEGAVEADDEEGGVQVVSTAVTEGTEVMILSCVTELKLLTTARGKKMGKWMIEDATGRVPAIVFPDAYEIMEQVVPSSMSPDLSDEVHADSGCNERKEKVDLSEQEVDEEPHRVVEEDARVIVWGKVSRESSGSSQIIVDDVQRVEDVNILVACAPYDRSRDVSLNRQIVHHIALKVMNIDLSQSGERTFVDKNGEVRKSRRKKSVRLELRNRIPLILECLDEEGSASTYRNVGNDARFPSAHREAIHALEQKTGMNIRFLSVLRDIMQKDDGENNDGAESLEVASREFDGGIVDDVLGVKNASEKPSLEKTWEESSAGDVQIIEGSSESSSLSTGASLVHDGLTEQADHELIASKIGLGDVVRDDDADQQVTQIENEVNTTSETVYKSTEEAMQILEDVQVHDVMLSPNEHDVFLSASDNIRSKFSKNNDVSMETSEGSQSGLSPKFGYRRDLFFSRTFMPTRGFDELTTHDAYQDSSDDRAKAMQSVSTSQSPLPLATLSVRENTFIRDPSPTEVQTVNTPVPGAEREVDSFATDPPVSPLTGTGFREDMSLFKNYLGDKQQTPTQGEVMTLGLRPNSHVDGQAEITRDNSKIKEGDQVPSVQTLESKITSTTVMPLEKIEKLTEVELDPDSEPVLIENEVDGKAVDLIDGLVVSFDNGKLPAVVDAIGVIASDVARKCGGGRHVMYGMSEVNLEKLCESGVSIHVSGRVAFANERRIYVIVDLRETTPSGKRKRVRSFGPIAIVMQTVDNVATTILKTKKAKKGVETFVQKLRKCHDEGDANSINNTGEMEARSSMSIADARASSSSLGKKGGEPIIHIQACDVDFAVQLKSDDVEIDGSVLLDGGEMVSYMARAAEVCAGKAVGESTKASVVIMDWLVAPKIEVWNSVRHVCVRTHLAGLSFGTLKVQVEGEILVEDGHAFKFLGLFGVRCNDGQLLKRMRVRLLNDDHDEALFKPAEVLSPIFGEARQELTQVLDGH